MAVAHFKHTLTDRLVRPAEFLGIVDLRLDLLGLTVEAAFEPNAFGARQSRIAIDSILRIRGVNGRCWATVTGHSTQDTLVIEPDYVPVLAAKATAPVKRAA